MSETFVQVDENLLQTIDDIIQCLDDGEMTVANDPLNKVPETIAHHQELMTVTQQTSPTDTLDPQAAHITRQEEAVADNSKVFTVQVKVQTSLDEGIEVVQEGQSQTYTQVQNEVLEKAEERDNEMVLEEGKTDEVTVQDEFGQRAEDR